MSINLPSLDFQIEWNSASIKNSFCQTAQPNTIEPESFEVFLATFRKHSSTFASGLGSTATYTGRSECGIFFSKRFTFELIDSGVLSMIKGFGSVGAKTTEWWLKPLLLK
jgi:hypothetical protein